MKYLITMKESGAFDSAIKKFHEAQDLAKERSAEPERLHRRKSEIEALLSDQESALSDALQQEELIAQRNALVYYPTEELNLAIEHRIKCARYLSQTKKLLKIVEQHLHDFGMKNYNILTPEQAAFRVIFEKLRDDILTTILPQLKNCQTAFCLATGILNTDLPNFLFNILQVSNPTDSELRENAVQMKKIILGLTMDTEALPTTPNTGTDPKIQTDYESTIQEDDTFIPFGGFGIKEKSQANIFEINEQ
jgi:hypothetical protein